jgi:hypothetical protein
MIVQFRDHVHFEVTRACYIEIALETILETSSNTAISIKVLGIANKFINFLAIPSSLSRSYSTFPLYSWTTLIEIAVYID